MPGQGSHGSLHPASYILAKKLMSASILLAFGFGNLAMLGWLAAAAAPLLIHLWSRHRFREAPWAAMQFLLAAMRKNARRLRLQQWLLLVVRTLIIALVVLAVAEPYGEQLLAGGSSVPMHKILVLDGSYSMDYRDEGATRFARAKQVAAALVRDGRPADSFTVILMASPAKTILSREIIDHTAIAAEIDSLDASHTSADLSGALTVIEEVIQQGKPGAGTTDRNAVYFFTDLQRATWAPRFNGERGNDANERIAAIAQQAALTVVDLGQPTAANLAVTNLTTTNPSIALNREATFDITLHQFANEPRPQCVVELLVDGVPVGEQSIDVPAGGDATARFTQRFNSAGQHTIEGRASGDKLEVDNRRWLVVPVREEVRVLCIAGRAGAARYVASALNPNPAGDSPIHPVIISEGDVPDVDLANFDCVFVCNVAQLTSNEAERLARFAQAGGGVIFFLGDRVDAERYNALAAASIPSPSGRGQGEDDSNTGNSSSLQASPAGRGSLVPAQLGEVVGQPQFGLDPLEYRHPIVTPFRGRERAGLLTTPVARYHRLELPRDRSDVEVAAAMKNGDPFIVTAPLGRGRTILVATDGSLTSVDDATGEPWTNWPIWPSFLPLVRELLAYATSGQQQAWQRPVGLSLTSDLQSPNLATIAPGTLRIERPDGQTAPVSIQPSPDGSEWSYTDTNLSGIYTLLGLPKNATLQLAINVDTAESDLTKAEPDELPPELHVGENSHDSDRRGASNLSRAGLNEPLLWMALAFLFLESLLAWQFGRGVV